MGKLRNHLISPRSRGEGQAPVIPLELSPCGCLKLYYNRQGISRRKSAGCRRRQVSLANGSHAVGVRGYEQHDGRGSGNGARSMARLAWPAKGSVPSRRFPTSRFAGLSGMNASLGLYYNQASVKRLRRRHIVRWMLSRIDARRGYTTRVTAGKHGNISFYDVWFGE